MYLIGARKSQNLFCEQERQLYEDLIDMEQDLDEQLPHKVMDKVRNIRFKTAEKIHESG